MWRRRWQSPIADAVSQGRYGEVAPLPSVTPVVPTTPVPLPELTVTGGVKNPRAGFVVVTKLLKPLPKLVLSVVGATPNPAVPEPKPLRKPFSKVLLMNARPSVPAVVVVGKLKLGDGNVPTKGLKIFVRFENAVEKTVGRVVAKFALVVGKAWSASKRAIGAVDAGPVVGLVMIVPVGPLTGPKIAF